MPTTYTSLLGLALPATGELSGTWGTTVNDAITSLVDSSVAGTTTLSSDADVTLTTTSGVANQARQAIILWTANGSTTRNITAPATSKTYVVINASAGTQSIVIRGVGPTAGVTVLKGERVVVAWNGSDFVKVSSFGGALTVSDLTDSSLTSGRVTYATTGGNLTDSANMTFNGTRLTVADLADSSLTSGRVTYAGASGLLQDSTNLTFNGTTLTATGFAGPLNGTVGATTPNTGAFTTLTTSSTVTLNGGTANGVLYLDGSKVATSGSALTFDGSSLGVGVAVPGQVIDGSAANPRLRLTATSTGYAASQFVNSSGASYFGRDNSAGGFFGIANGTAIYSSTSDPIGFYLSGSEQMRLTSTGLGIGTSSPQAKFVVSNAGAQGIELSYSAGLAANVLQSINRVGGADVDMAYYLGGLGSHKWYNNATLSATLNSSGNFGIGTSSPGYRLDVVGSTNGVFAGRIFNTNSGSSAYSVLWLGNDIDGTLGGILATSSTNTSYGGANSLNLYTFTARPIGFVTNNTLQMLLDASGNLGLGVTPSAWGLGKAFEVGALGNAVWGGAGYVDLMQNVAYTSGAYKYSTTAAAARYEMQTGTHVWFTAPSGTAGNAISFTQAMTLDADGELGVGITSPTARLHAYSATAMKQLTVDGTGAIKTGVNFANGGTTYGQIYFDNNVPYDMSVVQQYITGSLIFGTNSTERARITSTGNVVAGGSVALATNATDGFLYVPTCAGTPTGTPTAITGMAPIVVDTTNNKLYFYSGGQWRDAGP